MRYVGTFLLGAMRERLAEYLSEDQFPELENWLTMAENLMRSQLPQDAQ